MRPSHLEKASCWAAQGIPCYRVNVKRPGLSQIFSEGMRRGCFRGCFRDSNVSSVQQCPAVSAVSSSVQQCPAVSAVSSSVEGEAYALLYLWNMYYSWFGIHAIRNKTPKIIENR